MRKIFTTLSCLFLSLSLFSQVNAETKTILYLIPFLSDQVNSINTNKIETDNDIYQIPSFELVAFWEGAQLALEEFDSQGISLNVIVKDITDNEQKLKNILKDTTFMRNIDLIIGPFYAPLFEIAAKYAAIYEIPIVNPFSNRKDFLQGNPFVYKLIPSPEAKLKLLKDLLIDKNPESQFILYTENETSSEYQLYRNFFIQENINYSHIPFLSESSNLLRHLNKTQHSIVIVVAESVEKIISNIRSVSAIEKIPSATFIIPENWIYDIENELRDFNRLQVHFFSNYSLDRKDEKTVYFESEFIERFHSPPDIHRYSYQGYDITRFFVNYLIHDFDTTRFNYSPISFDFHFDKIENGGHENQRIRLLQMKDFELIEVEK